MKLKKILATAMAAVMAVAMLPASVKADTIEGGGVYLDTEVYNVVLPTTANMKFYLDPQGLTSMDSTGNIDSADLGKIVANTSSMSAINKSSVPVGLKMTYVVSGAGISVQGASGISDETGNEVAVSVTASMGGTYRGESVWDATSGSAVDTTTSGAITATPTFAGTAGSPGVATYIMGKADYDIEYSGTADDDKYDSTKYSYKYKQNTGSEIKLEIGGSCSKDGDWSDLAEGRTTLSLEATFKFYKVNDSTPASTTIDTGAEVSAESGPRVTIDAGLKVTATGLTAEHNYRGGSLTYYLKKPGESAFTKYPVQSSWMNWNSEGTWSATDGGYFDATLKSNWLDASRGGTVYVTITFADGTFITSNEVVVPN